MQQLRAGVQAFSALCSAWAENGSWCQAAALVQAPQLRFSFGVSGLHVLIL